MCCLEADGTSYLAAMDIDILFQLYFLAGNNGSSCWNVSEKKGCKGIKSFLNNMAHDILQEETWNEKA